MSPATVALALALLLGLQPVTTDLYLPALPQLKEALQAPMSGAQMTMSALLLAFGLSQLFAGPMSDRFGRRRVLLAGLLVYVAASLAAALAPDIAWLIAARAFQGVGMACAVVCARAMVRDLYEPYEGAHVMSRGLSGLGVIAILSPVLGGLLASTLGWRAALGAVACVGVVCVLYIWRLVPDTLAHRNPNALNLRMLAVNAGMVARHPTFRAWTALISATYGGLFTMLAGSSFIYMNALGLPAWGYGMVMAAASLSYLAGTVQCRRWLKTHGLRGAVQRGGYFTLAGGLGMVAVALAGLESVPLVLFTHVLYTFGHGIHQPCGQSGSVGAFPHHAGLASALSGFTLALVAFLVGLWLGIALDGTVRILALTLGTMAVLTTTVAWTLVQRHGEHFSAKPA